MAHRRVQLDLPTRSWERLKVLKMKTESASYAEVIKNALRLYEGMIEEIEQGAEFLIRKDGVVGVYKVFTW